MNQKGNMESRTKHITSNIIFALILESLQVVCNLIFPRLIIKTYGSSINGLTSTIGTMLTVINLIQAGAVGAATYEMFKPVSEKDYFTISRIYKSSRSYFSKLGFI